MTIGARLGVAIAAGVPVLVLVSMGPVAALVGSPSVVVWVVSALVGFLMSLHFAELASAYPDVNGGVATVAARVLRPRSRILALSAQWSYWFGWSPALAINGVLVGSYVQRLLLPHSPPWCALLIATAVLGASVTINHFGLRVGGRMQVVLLSCVVATVAVLFGSAFLRGDVRLANFSPFSPPGGWLSGAGWLAIGGGLFMAGWSAYGAELALTFSTRYRSGVRDALQAVVVVAVASVVAFAVVPFLLVGAVGVDVVQQDPAAAFGVLNSRAAAGASGVIFAVLALALVLGLNMIAIASSWTLHQMARSGDAWSFLGRLNRHGMPSNALRFDLVFNVGLLILITLLAGGRTSEVPIALLAAANVGYFVSMCLALWAAWRNHRSVSARGFIHLRPVLARLAPLLIGFNVVLLAAAGHAWGWRNLAIGAGALAAAVAMATWRTSGRGMPAASRTPVEPAKVVTLPACWGRAGAAATGGFASQQITP